MKKLAALAFVVTGFLFAGTAAQAGPQPACASLGSNFIKIERLTPTPDFPTTGNTNVRDNGAVPGYCYHTNLVHKPGTDLKLTINNQVPLTQTVVKSSATGVIASCVKWNDATNQWSFEPYSGAAPTLCGKPQPSCASLGSNFIKIERLTPTPDFPTTGNTNVRNDGAAPGFCYHTNLVHKPGTDLKLTINNQVPLTQTVVKSSATGVIASCVKWNGATSQWSFEPFTGVKPTLCGI